MLSGLILLKTCYHSFPVLASSFKSFSHKVTDQPFFQETFKLLQHLKKHLLKSLYLSSFLFRPSTSQKMTKKFFKVLKKPLKEIIFEILGQKMML